MFGKGVHMLGRKGGGGRGDRVLLGVVDEVHIHQFLNLHAANNDILDDVREEGRHISP